MIRARIRYLETMEDILGNDKIKVAFFTLGLLALVAFMWYAVTQ